MSVVVNLGHVTGPYTLFVLASSFNYSRRLLKPLTVNSVLLLIKWFATFIIIICYNRLCGYFMLHTVREINHESVSR